MQFITEFLPALKILMLTLPLSIFDFGTDVFYTKMYLTSSVEIVTLLGKLLLVALLVHNFVSSFYGLSILIRQPDAYPRLWKSKTRRFCTCLLHFLGLGGLVLHLDYFGDYLFSHRESAKNCRHLGKKRDDENDVGYVSSHRRSRF